MCAPVDQAVQSDIPTDCFLVLDDWYIPWAAGERKNGNGRERVKRGREKKFNHKVGPKLELCCLTKEL